MRVSYDAVVTSDATTQVDNEFYMSTLPDKKKYAHSVLASLTFTKIDASGKPLAGARFKIESSNRNQLVLPSGYANANTNRDASCDPDEAISKADGTVTSTVSPRIRTYPTKSPRWQHRTDTSRWD